MDNQDNYIEVCETCFQERQDLLDSINYAARILGSIMPKETEIDAAFPYHFLLFQPRDIVGGDFYCVYKQDNFSLALVADCTGHGVPGALLSMIGIASLRSVLSTKGMIAPGRILDHLRDDVKFALSQSLAPGSPKDSMDASLLIIDNNTRKAQFAGAYNPLLIYRENRLIELKGDKQPVGIHPHELPFSTHEIQLEEGDLLYLFTDGYQDQYGGERNLPYRSTHFKKFLHTLHNEDLPTQKQVLSDFLRSWRHNNKIPQTDDITILGIRV